MRRFSLAAAVSALVGMVLSAPSPAGAVGVGVYGTVGGGLSEWEASNLTQDRRDTRHSGAGLILDTSLPFDPFSYRLAIGWERVDHEAVAGTSRRSLEGIVIDQDLTLDLLGGYGPLRVWAGPELRLAFFSGAPSPSEDFIALGIGPVLGFDFEVAPALAISWKFGYLFTGYAGRRLPASAAEPDNTVGEGHAFATMAILFRIGEGSPEQGPRHDRREDGYPRRW